MHLSAEHPALDDPARVLVEAGRTADRLRGLSVARLRIALPDGGTRAERAFRLAQELADEAAELAGWPRRRLPVLPDTAAGDVLAVCAADFVDVLSERRDHSGATQAAESATERLIALRRLL